MQKWEIFEGPLEGRLSPVGRVGYRGFETQFSVGQPCVQVAAMVGGDISARSDVVCTFSNKTSHS